MNSPDDLSSTDALPKRIGRFRIESILGQGGFGVVYSATDEQLQRRVAIKVPRPELIQNPEDVELYLKEARTVAGIEHPNIVPVLEVGSTPEFPIYVVSKFIEGGNLAEHVRINATTEKQACQWLMEICEALRTAHRLGVVHRDIKPQNIMVDKHDHVYLVDFGLALRDEDIGKRSNIGGTPAYMSPEQAKGEGHRVDGRSDIFSLGVVFYELLTGHRPFNGQSRLELIEQIVEQDPKPIRQWNDSVDRELERICSKMLSKRKSDRFASAKDIIDDLIAYLKRTDEHASQNMDSSTLPVGQPLLRGMGAIPAGSLTRSTTPHETPLHETPLATTPGSSPEALKIVPKGLRSFDHHDADFFLELLPGPRNRFGLPEIVAFWKRQIEERDADKTFSVGLVYGPSGCGKSSLMKAGLIPRLEGDVVAIYLEATPDQTEANLLSLLRKRFDAMDISYERAVGLGDLLASVRRGRVLRGNKKLLIVIDQFEQWLYAHTESSGTELVRALMHCDGSRLQAIVMVRDDFWMGATRFFRDLDQPLVERHNSASVDLFDIDHAKRVLQAFGNAFGKLANSSSDAKREQREFISEAVRGLSQSGKVISIRLSLFAEMMKGREWKIGELRAVGGTEGVGATFLEETFSAPGAPPNHRLHQTAATKVLRSLLPDAGTDIKGTRRSRNELLGTSGYATSPRDYADLLRILDHDLRLITPVDQTALGDETKPTNVAELVKSFDESQISILGSQISDLQSQYQLTHDYLVPSLRDWLTRKQRETRRGRAELLLAERSAIWNSKHENKQLPTLSEWIGIRWLTTSRQWTTPQSTMMRRAGIVHWRTILGSLVGVIACVFLGATIWRQINTQIREAQAAQLVEGLLRADSTQLMGSIEKLQSFRDVAVDDLEQAFQKAEDGSVAKLHAALGFIHTAKQQSSEQVTNQATDYAVTNLLQVEPNRFLPVRKLLVEHSTNTLERLWQTALDEKASAGSRLRASAGLAEYAPKDERWTNQELSDFVAKQLVDVNPAYLAIWQEAFAPVASQLHGPLLALFKNDKSSDSQKTIATSLIANYSNESSSELIAAIMVAEPKSYEVIFPVLEKHGAKAISQLESILDRQLKPDWRDAPIDPAWKEPTSESKQAFADAHGMIAARFAVVQDMQMEVFLKVAEQLRSSGYRPTRIRAWQSTATANENRLAAIWTRDGRDWSIQTDVPEDELPTRDSVAERDGMCLDDLCSIESPGREAPKYMLLWTVPSSPDERRTLVANVKGEELTGIDKEMSKTKSALRIYVRTTSDRERRYSVIYGNRTKGSEFKLEFEGWDLIDQPQFDIAIARPGKIADPLDVHRNSIAAFEKLTEEKRKEPSVRENLADALKNLGRFDEALPILDELIAENKASPNVLMSRSLVLANLRQSDGAKQAYEAFAKVNKTESFDDYVRIQVALFADGEEQTLRMIGESAAKYGEKPDGLYNIVCAAALCGSSHKLNMQSPNVFVDKAFGVLELAIEKGYSNHATLSADSDLAILHSDRRFESILNRLRPKQPFSGIWHADPTVESLVIPMDPTRKDAIPNWIDLAQVRRLTDEGYRPVAIACGNESSQPSVSILMHIPIVPDEVKESLAKEQARSAATLLKMGASDRVWPLLKFQPDPRVRSYLLAYLTQFKIDPATLLKRLNAERDVSSQRALAIAIGDFAEADLLSTEQKIAAILELSKRFRDHSDSGVHSANEWALNKLGSSAEVAKIQSELATGKVEGERNWYTTRTSTQTFVLLGPVSEFRMGSPLSERERDTGEKLHRRSIERRFAMATTPVTKQQMLAFKPDFSHSQMQRYPEDDCPIGGVTWFEAAAYCNWLSEKEGIPESEWCYKITSRGTELKPNHLGLTGYRLPTESEMEYAIRGLATTAYSFGESPLLLDRYAWYIGNSNDRTWPVRSLRPNDFGTFGVHGNLYSWCVNTFQNYRTDKHILDDRLFGGGIISQDNFPFLRGGSFIYRASVVRSANRDYNRPDIRNDDYGFRSSRTYP